MFPLKDNIPAERFPAVNLWLIIVNALAFLYELSLGPALDNFIMVHGFVPARFMAEQAANPFDPGRFVPIFSSMFLHGNLLHIVANMWMLWIFGDNVEDRMGHGRYLVFYLLCGVAAVFLQTLSGPFVKTPMIGASGAISGVIAAYFLLYPRARILTFVPIFIFFYFIEVPAFFFIGFWFLMQFLQGAMHHTMVDNVDAGGVAWWAHVGGFVAGLALVRLFIINGKNKRR